MGVARSRRTWARLDLYLCRDKLRHETGAASFYAGSVSRHRNKHEAVRSWDFRFQLLTAWPLLLMLQ